VLAAKPELDPPVATPRIAVPLPAGGLLTARLHDAAAILLYAFPALFVLGRGAADGALILIALLFLARSALDRDWRWLRTPWVVAALGAWGYLVLRGLMPDAGEGALARAVLWLRFIAFAAALQHWVLTEAGVRRRFLMALGPVAALVVIDCLWQFATGTSLFGTPYERRRLTGPFGSTVPGTFLANTGLILLGAALGLALGRGGGWRWAAAASLAGLLALTIGLTGERMALLTFLLGLLVMLVLLPGARRPLAIAGLVALVALGSVVAGSSEMATRLIGHTSADLEDFWSKRYGEKVVRSITLWREEPLLGIGIRRFRTACANDHFQPLGPVEDRCYTHPHNIYLEWLVETGALGLGAFLVLVGLWAAEAVRGHRRGVDPALVAGALAALVVFLWPLRSGMSFFGNWHAILFWLVLGVSLAVFRAREPTVAPPAPPS
jgi:O-antigen ligase